MFGSILVGEAKVFRHGKAKTLYVSIPSQVALDSAFEIKEGDAVEVRWDPNEKAVVIRAKQLGQRRFGIKKKDDNREAET